MTVRELAAVVQYSKTIIVKEAGTHETQFAGSSKDLFNQLDYSGTSDLGDWQVILISLSEETVGTLIVLAHNYTHAE